MVARRNNSASADGDKRGRASSPFIMLPLVPVNPPCCCCCIDDNDVSIIPLVVVVVIAVAESPPPEMFAKSSSSPDDSLRCNLHAVSAIVIKSIVPQDDVRVVARYSEYYLPCFWAKRSTATEQPQQATNRTMKTNAVLPQQLKRTSTVVRSIQGTSIRKPATAILRSTVVSY